MALPLGCPPRVRPTPETIPVSRGPVRAEGECAKEERQARRECLEPYVRKPTACTKTEEIESNRKMRGEEVEEAGTV